MAFVDPLVGRDIIDSGMNSTPGKVTLAEACKCGDALGYSSGWKRALATVGTAITTRVIALKDGAIGDEIPVSPHAVVSGFTGATLGSPVYQDEGTNNGGYTQTAPSTTGDVNKIIGYALSATVVQFDTTARPDSVV